MLLIYLICGLFENFSLVLLFIFSYLAEAFIQSDLQMRTIEAIKTNKRATIRKCYISIVLYFNFSKKHAAFCPSNNKKDTFDL